MREARDEVIKASQDGGRQRAAEILRRRRKDRRHVTEYSTGITRRLTTHAATPRPTWTLEFRKVERVNVPSVIWS